MVDLRTGLRPREDLAPLPPPVGEIVARARRNKARRRLTVAVSALGAVALLGVVVSTVGSDTGEPPTRTGGLTAEAPDTTVATTSPSSPSTTVTTSTTVAEDAPGATTPTTDASPPAVEPQSPPPTPAAPPADAPVTVIQDTNRGSGIGQVQFAGAWHACTTTCGKAPDGTYQWTNESGATATLRFDGTRVALFGVKEPWGYLATVAIDGGAPVDVDFYASPATATPVVVFRSPVLAAGPHTLVVTLTDRHNPASAGGSEITGG